MFEIKIDGVEALVAKLGKYESQITAMQSTMPAELESWQREDLKRRYPHQQVETVNTETNATTSIWPRSRTPSKDQHHRKFQGPKQHRIATRGPVVRSNRPILRASLLQQLWDRMARLLSEATKWP